MTAIAGLWCFDGSGGASPIAEKMGDALAPYGPDRAGMKADRSNGLTLVWRQFLATEEDAFEHQPLISADGAVWLVADARIDNRAELAGELGIATDGPEPISDSEFILAAYRRWGTGCAARLIGDFAFAIWDRQAGRLFLARDFIGNRPLYFARGSEFFAFASMPKGLWVHPEVSNALDETEVGVFAALLPAHGTATVHRDIGRIPPGHFMVVCGKQHTLQRYWHAESIRRLPAADFREYSKELRRLHTMAVGARLRRPFGTGISSHLSGGYDSGSVTALAAGLLAEQGQRLTAFTAAPRQGFPVSGRSRITVDESDAASLLARRFPNIDHRIIRTDKEDLLHPLERYTSFLGAPFINPCNLVWIGAIATEAARRGIRVILNAGMGNMTVSYDGTHYLAHLFGRGRWISLARTIAGLRRDGHSLRASLHAAMGPYLPSAVLDTVYGKVKAGKSNPFLHTALSPDFAKAIDIDSLARNRKRDIRWRPWKDGRAARLSFLLPYDGGARHHATLARYGIDGRDPTLDQRLLEFCLAVPMEHYLRGGRRAALFRDAFADLFPPERIARRVRGLQAADWYEWAVAGRDEIAAEIERIASSPLARRILDVERLRRLIASFPDPATPVDALPVERLQSPGFDLEHRHALLRGLAVGHFIRMSECGNE